MPKRKILGGKENKTAADFRRLARMKEVSNLYLQGYAIYMIAEKLGIAYSTVGFDLEKMRVQWLATSVVDFSERKAMELAKIDLLEETAHKAWFRSCEDSEQKKVGKTEERIPIKEIGPDGKATWEPKMVPTKVIKSRDVKGQSGNPRFLDTIAWCIETRLKMFNLLQPDTTNINNNTIVALPDGFWEKISGAVSHIEDDPVEAKIKNVTPGKGESNDQ